MNSLKTLWDRLKKIKHIEIYIAIVAALIIIAIYLSSLSFGGKDEQSDNNSQNSPLVFSTSAEYVDYLENKLEYVLSSIKGTGSASVMVTLESGFAYDYATEEETLKTSEGSKTTTKLVLVDGQPVIVEEHFPVIKGIVVVAKGAEDIGVRMNILNLIQTVVNVDSASITILAAN